MKVKEEEEVKEIKKVEGDDHNDEDLKEDDDDDDVEHNYSENKRRVIKMIEEEKYSWRKHITVRGIVVSSVIGSVYSLISMKLNLTTGIAVNLNVSAGLIAFLAVRSWTGLLHKAGFNSKPFTPQENTLIQTAAVACYSIAVGGGFASYLLGLNRKTYELAGVNTKGNSPTSIKEPALGWMTGYLFVVCFVGLFVLIPLRKIMIVDLNLTYPSGLATAVLINGFHNQKDDTAKKQVRGFTKFFSASFLWGFFKWFFSGDPEYCGFSQFPTFGLKAWKKTFYFDFSMTYVGAGMLCPHLVNLSLLSGAVLSYGIMWPLIAGLKGQWFPRDLSESNMKSLYGYKVFISVALILGDGLYSFIKIMSCTLINIHYRIKLRKTQERQRGSDEDEKQDQVFLRQEIPMWISLVGYVAFGIISIIAVPSIFPELKWYYIVGAYVLAPSLAFCNAYGAGLTDINMAYNYGKIALFLIAALSGKEHGLVAGLAGCGLVKSVLSVACILMQDFKTAHLTLTSPRAMFVSQMFGTLLGCIITPLTFFLFYKAFDVGNPNGEFKAPYALIYRNMAILGVEGFSALPRHCLQLCYGFFAFAIGVNLARDLSPPGIGKWMPLPMAMAVPFLVGAYFAIDMCLGSLVVLVVQRLYSRRRAESMVPAIASGLICGEGLWTLPASVLALAGVNPPICMKFEAS